MKSSNIKTIGMKKIDMEKAATSLATLTTLLTVLLTILLTTGCTTPFDHRCARLPTGGKYCLQPTTALTAFDGQQLVEATYKGQKETLVVEMEVDATGLRFAGLTPLGHKVLHITYNNLEAQALTTPNKRLDPVLMVALLQLTLWPADAVRQGLKAPLKLEEARLEKTQIEEAHDLRRIVNGSHTVLTIRRFGTLPPYQRLQMTIPSVELGLDIKTLDPTSP